LSETYANGDTVRYEYDAWSKVLSADSSIAQKNHFVTVATTMITKQATIISSHAIMTLTFADSLMRMILK